MHIRAALLMILALICVASVGWAQAPHPVVGFRDGFFVQSADGENRANVEPTTFEDRSGARPAGNVVVFRAQSGF